MSSYFKAFQSFVQSIIPARLPFGAFAFVFCLLIFTIGERGVFAATFTVNNTGDGADASAGDGVCETAAGGGVCTLRAAAQEANALAGDDTIQFSALFNSAQTIALAGGQIVISSNINIVGTGAKLLSVQNTAAQSPTSRVFEIAASSVSLSGMKITGGNVDGNGAGISFVEIGTLSVTSCIISGNTASGFGGGIRSIGNLNVSGSTVSGNVANSPASGGGGIDHAEGTLNINSTTVSGNTKNGGNRNGAGVWTHGTTVITGATITNNFTLPGGISAGGVHKASNGYDVTVSNSIIAGNQNGGMIRDVSGGTFASGGYNLIGNHDGAFNLSQPTDQYGFGANVLNPKLAPLADNGGATPTHALLIDSPALDKGNSFGLTTDQRGFLRTFDNPSIPNTADGTDIGALERQASESAFRSPFDFDGDGKTDISIFRPAPGDWWYLKSSNGGNAAAHFGSSTDKIVPADFTGDGKTDIAFWRPSTGFWFVLRSEDFSFYSVPYGISTDIPVPADYDRDGKADLAVFRPATATWFIQRSSTGADISQQFGAVGDVPVVADYDNDDKADIATYRPGTGEWWIQRSASVTVSVYQFGASTDKPVQGDYTGDGKADVAFWRPSTGQWFVLRSEDNSFFSFPFGISTDIPAPGDYDGDSKFDGGVFRESNTTWYVRKSTGGTLIQNFGQSGDRPVPNAFVP